MKSEYRVIFTATFDTAEERNKAYDSLKSVVAATVKSAAAFKRADMTKDEYLIQESQTTEKVI